MYPECGNPFIGNRAQTAFAALFGWVPALAYTGALLLIWHIMYIKTSILNDHYREHIPTLLIMAISMPLWIIIIPVLYRLLHIR